VLPPSSLSFYGGSSGVKKEAIKHTNTLENKAKKKKQETPLKKQIQNSTNGQKHRHKHYQKKKKPDISDGKSPARDNNPPFFLRGERTKRGPLVLSSPVHGLEGRTQLMPGEAAQEGQSLLTIKERKLPRVDKYLFGTKGKRGSHRGETQSDGQEWRPSYWTIGR